MTQPACTRPHLVQGSLQKRLLRVGVVMEIDCATPTNTEIREIREGSSLKWAGCGVGCDTASRVWSRV